MSLMDHKYSGTSSALTDLEGKHEALQNNLVSVVYRTSGGHL